MTVGCKGIMAGMYIAEFAHKRSNGSRDLGGNQVNGDDGWPACLPATKYLGQEHDTGCRSMMVLFVARCHHAMLPVQTTPGFRNLPSAT